MDNTVLKTLIIVAITMLASCTSSQSNDEKIMSSYCKEAYENLYSTYNTNQKGTSGEYVALGLVLTAGENYAKKDEFERLEKECN